MGLSLQVCRGDGELLVKKKCLMVVLLQKFYTIKKLPKGSIIDSIFAENNYFNV